MSRSEIKNKIEKNLVYFFFNFQKIGSGGSVKRKIKKLWPNFTKKHNKCVVCMKYKTKRGLSGLLTYNIE